MIRTPRYSTALKELLLIAVSMSLYTLYSSGLLGFVLTEAGSRIAVNNIALKEISH